MHNQLKQFVFKFRCVWTKNLVDIALLHVYKTVRFVRSFIFQRRIFETKNFGTKNAKEFKSFQDVST